MRGSILITSCRKNFQTGKKKLQNCDSELESTNFQLENRPATSGHLYQEIEQLKERNRLLQIKNREERQKLEEELAALKYRDESQSRRLQEKQARLDELEIQIEEAQIAKPEPETAIDLSEQVPQIINFLKELLPPDTKWPKRVLPKLRQFLEPKEEKNND